MQRNRISLSNASQENDLVAVPVRKGAVYYRLDRMEIPDTRTETIRDRRRTHARQHGPYPPKVQQAIAQQAPTDPAILLNRLHKTWKSLPLKKEARVYSPSATQLTQGGNVQYSKKATVDLVSQDCSSAKATEKATSLPQKKAQAAYSAALTAFEQKYAVDDPLMRYVLHVIRTGSSVLRSEIPRGKNSQRRVRPEEDVLYLMHSTSPPCGFRNVYWLTLVDEATVLHEHTPANEYFTLGSHGITRFKSGQGVEFSDLASWVDEKRAFDHMTKMEGLDRIQQMIFFFSWKRQAVQRRWHRVQERLACTLFTCHPVAAKILMIVRDVCKDVENEATRRCLDSSTTYSVEQFVSMYHDRLKNAKTLIKDRVRWLCEAINRETRNIARYQEAGSCSYAITDRDAFSQALRLSSLRDRMFTFLRLVDCHVSEAVFQHISLVLQDIHAQVCGSPLTAALQNSNRNGRLDAVEESESEAYLLLSEPSKETIDSLKLGKPHLSVKYTVWTHEADAPSAPFPHLYIRLEEDINFDEDVTSATMRSVPSKVEVLESVHEILVTYCVEMDSLPRVLSDTRFESVRTPFVPAIRYDFINKNFLKPSKVVLESCEDALRQMRTALDVYFRHIAVLQQEHLRCARAIKVAEREALVEPSSKMSETQIGNDDEDVKLPDLPDESTSSTAYELAQKTWNRLARYANSAAPMLQVGILLFDQHLFVEKLRGHVDKRITEMDGSLPSIYQQVLINLLDDVDGRIEKVTKIPTNLAEAGAWLIQVSSMMLTHPFRQRLDTKRANLERLRALMKERDIVALDTAVQDTIRKLELDWESSIETLLLCLSRVEERGSEHRRSVQDVITNADEYVAGQLMVTVKMFEGLPCSSGDDDGGVVRTDPAKNDLVVQQLEDLVSMDLERKKVTQQFEDYDREYRMIMELPSLKEAAYIASLSSATDSKMVSAGMDDKLPSELLLQYIITSLEVRQWFESWVKLRENWLNAPISGVHPGTMINRIKQFRRRLGYASPRLLRLSSILFHVLSPEQQQFELNSGEFQDEEQRECVAFAKKDFKLMRVFDESIEDMLNCNRIFQAVVGGVLPEARWAAMQHHLGAEVSGRASQISIRRIKEKCTDAQVSAFMKACDECVVETKLHTKMEQVRQRLAQIEICVEEINYSVRCVGIEEALAQLDDIAVDLKLCLFGQNPALQSCLEISADLEQKMAVCKHILLYQKLWKLRCEATKLHELEEFFSKRFSGNESSSQSRTRKGQHKPGVKQEKIVWHTFVDASHAWTDRLRRLFFVGPRQPEAERAKPGQALTLGRKVSVPMPTPTVSRRSGMITKSFNCALDDVVSSFEEFDFDSNFAACERGVELIQIYLESLREHSPRLYCLDETTFLRLLLRDSDVQQLHQALAILFPRVHRFVISHAVNRMNSLVNVSRMNGPVRASDTDGTIVISGLEDFQGDNRNQSGQFRLSVAKIGRVKFWFTRLEEEMTLLVLTNLKRSFEWIASAFGSAEVTDCHSFFPQSILTACNLRFTYEMNQALHPTRIDRLQKLQADLTVMLETLSTAWHSNTAYLCLRLENVLLLTAHQSKVVRHMMKLSERGHDEEISFFWSLQLQTRVFMETLLGPGPTTLQHSGKNGVTGLARNELFPTHNEFRKVGAASHSGQSSILSVCCQIAHFQLPLGQEFTGSARVATIVPFTERCQYALFNALKMCHTALVLPYSAPKSDTSGSSLVWGLGQTLMRLCIEYSCGSSAGIATVHHFSNLMSASSRLDGFLIVRDLLQLSTRLIAVIREKMLQNFHQSSTTGERFSSQEQTTTVTSVLSHQLVKSSAIFIPFDSVDDLERSGLMKSIRSQFRAVAVVCPDIHHLVEILLIANGYTAADIQELHVAEVCIVVWNSHMWTANNLCVEAIISRVIQEASRLRASYVVSWDSQPKSVGKGVGSLTSLFNKRGDCDNSSSAVSQFFFYRAFTAMLLKADDTEVGEIPQDLHSVLVEAFPLSQGGRLVAKNKANEDAVAAAVSIYLESVFSVAEHCEQFDLIMELWRALQTYSAAIVYGAAGSGKTTCIASLHRALVALELSQLNQDDEEGNRRSSQVAPPAALTQLVILNPQLLALDQFYSSVAVAYSAEGSGTKGVTNEDLKWVLVDGEVNGAILERLLGADNRALSSTSSLPACSVLHRGEHFTILSADSPSTNARLLFETIDLKGLSPSALCRCWALYVPSRCITIANIMDVWRARWRRQVSFPLESFGTERLEVVFNVVDVLIVNICVPFVVEEAAHEQPDSENGALKLGYLPLKQITQSALALVAHCCFLHRALLLDLPVSHLVELVVFAVLWGFSGHCPEPLKHKFEHYMRAKCTNFSETRHLSEVSRSLMESTHFEDVWDEIQPTLAGPLSFQPRVVGISEANRDVPMQSTLDPLTGQVLVLSPAATSLIRVCTLMLHSSQSFLLVGPAASGKTSLMRWLVHRNSEDEAAEMKIEASLDERRVHGILDWMRIPAAWFLPADNMGVSRAKMREEADLFASRARHSFVFLDDLEVTGSHAQEVQAQYVRTVLDHRVGASTRHKGFRPLDKHVGAAMRLDESGESAEPSSFVRLTRHFVVLRVPTYTPKELLSLFRVKYQGYFNSSLVRANATRRLSMKQNNAGGGQELPLEEVVLRASIDFATEVQSLQQLASATYSYLFTFNLHHVDMLLQRVLNFADGVSAASRRSTNSFDSGGGVTLVDLGRAHQSWLSELQNLFVANSSAKMPAAKAGESGSGNVPPTVHDQEVHSKLNSALRYLSEKYFSVALRSDSDHALSVSVESLHFMIELATHHVQAPLLQPRLIQLREFLNSYMTTSGSRRSSGLPGNRNAGALGAGVSSIVDVVTGVLLEMSSRLASRVEINYAKDSRKGGELLSIEMKLLLSSSWCLTQTMHLVQALHLQQQIIVSPTAQFAQPLAEKLLRFACDLHGFKIHVVDDHNNKKDRNGEYKRLLNLVLGSAGVRQERVALWVHQRQLQSDSDGNTNPLADTVKELCLHKLPSLIMLPGGEELRNDILLSCIQARDELELVSEAELLSEFQRRIDQNFRLCIFQEDDDSDSSILGHGTTLRGDKPLELLGWMKTRSSCHWRCLIFTDFEFQQLLPELISAALSSPELCGVQWDVQQFDTYGLLFQRVHSHMMSASSSNTEPISELNFLLSFLVNFVVEYRTKREQQRKTMELLEGALETLAFARDKVIPASRKLQTSLEQDMARVEHELEALTNLQENEETLKTRGSEISDEDEMDEGFRAAEVEENTWIERALYEELLLAKSETQYRLDQVSQYNIQWDQAGERLGELYSAWSRKIKREQAQGIQHFVRLSVLMCSQRVYPFFTSMPPKARASFVDELETIIREAFDTDIADTNTLEAEPCQGEVVNDESCDAYFITRFLWTSRFHFLRDKNVYNIVRSVDELSDRIPVVVDSSGVFARFFVHFFSGHTVFSSLPGCKQVGEIENDSSIVTKEAFVISCDDEKFETLLQEAQRLNLPVLLVNFRCADNKLLERLQPYIVATRVTRASLRGPILHQLTLNFYEEQRRQRQKRPSTLSSAVAALSSFPQVSTAGTGAAMVARRAVRELGSKTRPSNALLPGLPSKVAPSLVMSEPSKVSDHRARRQANIGNKPSENGFQMYAVTSEHVPTHIQCALSAQFAIFSLSLGQENLENLLQLPRVEKSQHLFVQELRADQIGLADYSVKLAQQREQLEQLMMTLKPAVGDLHESPFASRMIHANSSVPIQEQERFIDLATQLAAEEQTELIWKSRKRDVHQKQGLLVSSMRQYLTTATRLAHIARAITASSSLTFGERTSPFYLHNYRYLESAVAQEFDEQDDDISQLSLERTAVIMKRILLGFVSESHQQIFRLFQALQGEIVSDEVPAEDEAALVLRDVVTWIVCTRVHRSVSLHSAIMSTKGSSGAENIMGMAILSGRRNSLASAMGTSTSLVERLRRRVKLCAYLFNGWKPSCNTKNKKMRGPRPLLHTSSGINCRVQNDTRLGKTDSSDNEPEESRQQVVARLQQLSNDVLAAAETFWYEWKTTRAHLQSDLRRLVTELGFSDVTLVSFDKSTALPSAKLLVTLDDMASHIEPKANTRSTRLALLLLAKELLPSSFADAVVNYLDSYTKPTNVIDNYAAEVCEPLVLGPASASVVADVAPSRGKQTRAHLPRALILYLPTERDHVALAMAAVEIVPFVDLGSSENDSRLRDELVRLITSKRKFVLELLSADLTEAALALMSTLINEHALLSVPEWYLLASYDVATAIENGKLTVMNRIAVFSSVNEWLRQRSAEQNPSVQLSVRNKLMEEFGLSKALASSLISAVLQGRESSSRQPLQAGLMLMLTSLEDLVKHCASIHEVAVGNTDRERMLKRLIHLLNGVNVAPGCSQQEEKARLSAALLSDLLCAGQSFIIQLGYPEEDWVARHSLTSGKDVCERLWAFYSQICTLFRLLRQGNKLHDGVPTHFFPWHSYDDEVTAQLASFESLGNHVRALHTPCTRLNNRQQQLATLARGYIPFDWIETFFAGASWPRQASGIIAVAQLQLLVACRVGVLVRCFQGDRAWALNLAVINDVCSFLRELREFVAGQLNASLSQISLVLELDANAEAGDATTDESAKMKKLNVIVKQFASSSGGESQDSEWHGAVLHSVDSGVESWGVRVDALVLVEQDASLTRLHPLPLCRLMCQVNSQDNLPNTAPVVLLPSLSLYQPPPMLNSSEYSEAVSVSLGRSIYSVVDIELSNCDRNARYAVGVPIFPDDDSLEAN